MKQLQDQQTPRQAQRNQANSTESGNMLAEAIRKSVQAAIYEIVEQEIQQLCGSKYKPQKGNGYYRAGSTQSIANVQGESTPIKRSRVRQQKEHGPDQEVSLTSWAALQDPQQKQDAIMRAILCGVSTRKVKALHEQEIQGMSKSSISRLWQQKARELLEGFNQAELNEEPIVVLMLDGVVLSKHLTAIVALGVSPSGHKRLLGFQVGSTENVQVCNDLLKNLIQRGLHVKPGHRLLAVLDGSKALENSTRRYFPGVYVQRCLVHKERNLKAYLSKRDGRIVSNYFNRLRKVEGKDAAEEVFRELKNFVSTKNRQAAKSLEEAGQDLITLHCLGVPSTLNRSLLSTNCIENVMRNLRGHSGRVCRWRVDSDQADLWLASGLMLAQKGFKRIQGYDDLDKLLAALKSDPNRRAPLGGLPLNECLSSIDSNQAIANFSNLNLSVAA